MSNNTVAPACPVSFNQQPLRSFRQPGGVDVGSIPPARDLPSVINAINLMNNVIQHLTRGMPQVNNVYPTGVGEVPSPVPPPPPKYDDVTWRETKRDYKTGEVINPEDDEQKVEIKYLTRIQWTEDVTGHRLVYVGQS